MSAPESRGSGIDRVTAERGRQISAEGFADSHDDNHVGGELARAAACYAVPPDLREHMPAGDHRPRWWPWKTDWWKPTPGAFTFNHRIRELEKAGALVCAEIDRLLRLADYSTKQLAETEAAIVALKPQDPNNPTREELATLLDLQTLRAHLLTLLSLPDPTAENGERRQSPETAMPGPTETPA